jgi:signal transduction histidine kinase
MLVIGAVLLIGHWRGSSGATRRALAPVLLAAAAAVLLLASVLVVSAFGVETEGSPLLWLADVAFATIPIAFLVGLLRTRLHRSAVADLVVELGSLPSPAQLRDAIARCLGDPSLELAFWLAHDERYVDSDGHALDPAERAGRAVTALEHDGKQLAALVYDPALRDEPELLDAVGAAASLALENARLQAELHAQLVEVRASRARIVEAGDAERRRLERNLHDGAQQHLLGIRLALQLARARLADAGAPVDELLAEADTEVVGALAELRALARGIHPAILTEEGLAPALAALARRAPVPVEMTICRGRLPLPVEATAYFVSAEALANLAKHARASSASIDVRRVNGRVAIAVTDDGVGGADAEGAGLRGLRDRVEALDGRLEIESPPGGGTRVSAAIPCA